MRNFAYGSGYKINRRFRDSHLQSRELKMIAILIGRSGFDPVRKSGLGIEPETSRCRGRRNVHNWTVVPGGRMYSRVADLRQRLEALASKLSELEEIRHKVAQAEDEARTRQGASLTRDRLNLAARKQA